MKKFYNDLCSELKEKSRYDIVKDIISPFLIFVFGVCISIHINSSQEKLSKKIAKSAEQSELLQVLTIPKSLDEQLKEIETLCFYVKNTDQNLYRYELAHDLLRTKSKALAEKLKLRSWAESDSSMFSGGNWWVSYRNIVTNSFQGVYEADPSIVKEALFSVFKTNITDMVFDKNSNAGVLIVFANLPPCFLSHSELMKLKKVTEYPWSDDNRKYVVSQYEIVERKSKQY